MELQRISLNLKSLMSVVMPSDTLVRTNVENTEIDEV